MISAKIFYLLLLFMVSGLSSSCSISTSFNGQWIQPGLSDFIAINDTWFSSKGACLTGQQDVKNKFIYYNEQSRCKRCILFIPRHSNALQYRESECFDADDDHTRICASITPDTVLYTLFRDNAQSISCPFDQSWSFEKTRQICQPKAFHNCLAIDTFQISYHNRCQVNQGLDTIAKCFAQFSDGNMHYVISRSIQEKKFICFSYTKVKTDGRTSLPKEVYLSEDETCRDLLTRESALILTILPNKHQESKISMPDWTQGTWLSIDSNRFHINQSEIIMQINNHRKSLRIMHSKKQQESSIRLRAKSLEQCSSKFYCIKIIYRSPAVIDLSIGFDEHRCKESSIHYTLFKPTINSEIFCPQMGIYKSLNTYRSSLPISSCSIGLWTLSIGCDVANKSELLLSTSCRHELVPEVQVLTSMKGLCLASWQTDHRFQRTLILYEKSKAFCLIQPLKPLLVSWIFPSTSCSHIGLSSINVENSFRYSTPCLSSSSSARKSQFSFMLFYFTIQVLIYM